MVQAFDESGRLARRHFQFLHSALRVGIRKSTEGKPQYAHQQREAGTIYAVVFLIMDVSFVVGQFGPFIQSFTLAASAGQSIFALIDHSKSHIDVYSDDGETMDNPTISQGISFQDVSFAYPAQPSIRVLDGLNVTFHAGKVTGIVGGSGSGKSTIAALLLRLYDPTSGRITFGRTEIRSFHVRSLRSKISLVDQNLVLFSGTILQNIRHGPPQGHGLSESEILKACVSAASDAYRDFLYGLTDGIHTTIGGSGNTQLSGGQKQRICLARALVRNPSLLILDEYTSAMDANSEALVLEALKRGSSLSGRTTIIIAHRLATVKDAHNILVMKDGTLLEEGNHDTLIQANGDYKALVDAQNFNATNISMSSSTVSISKTSTTKALLASTPRGFRTLSPQSENIISQHSQRSSAELVKRCLSLSKPERAFICLGLFASMASRCIIIGEALVSGNLVRNLNERSETENFGKTNFLCLMFFVLSLIALLAYSCSGAAFGVVSEALILRVRNVSLRTILTQDMAWFSEPSRSPDALMSS